MNGTLVTMPDAKTLTAQLIEVDNESHLEERLYPRICQHLAGQEKYGLGIIMGLQLAIHEYVADGLPSMMVGMLNLCMEDFITAIAPEAVRQEALDQWATIKAQPRG